MQNNFLKENILSNQNNYLDIDRTNDIHRPKTVNTNDQSGEKVSFSGISIGSNNKNKENDSYNNFISRIKLNYNLLHPKQRIQTIILHSSSVSDKSMYMNDTSINDINYNELSDNMNDNLNTGFILDNSGKFPNYNHHKRRTINNFNRINDERLQKGEEDEKTNLSAKTKKNKLDKNFNNNIFNNDNTKINLGSIFNSLNENNQKEKVLLNDIKSDNDQKRKNNELNEGSNKSENILTSFQYKNNSSLGSNIDKNELFKKGENDMNMNYPINTNDVSTNMNTHNTIIDNYQNKLGKKNEKELISSFNYGINNNSLPNPIKPYFDLDKDSEENINKSINDKVEYGNYFTFRPEENAENKNQYNQSENNTKKNSLSQNNSENMKYNNNENAFSKIQKDKHSIKINLNKKPKVMNNISNNDLNILDNNIENHIEYIEYNNNEVKNSYNKNKDKVLNLDEINNDSKVHECDLHIIKEVESQGNFSVSISEINESDLEEKKEKKRNNSLKSFLYGFLFGSAASGIFWLKDEDTRKFFYEKMKGINFNSIFKFLKRIFANPFEFFKKIISKERMKDYLKVFGLTVGQFLDIFESYDDWFRLIGIVLSMYLIWLIIKSFLKAFFKVWKYYN
jgi:hypothetical protein